jgi:hypothetical protein
MKETFNLKNRLFTWHVLNETNFERKSLEKDTFDHLKTLLYFSLRLLRVFFMIQTNEIAQLE